MVPKMLTQLCHYSPLWESLQEPGLICVLRHEILLKSLQNVSGGRLVEAEVLGQDSEEPAQLPMQVSYSITSPPWEATEKVSSSVVEG
jgi:hypothetical protein